MTKYYMGISGLHHDSAAALIDNEGNIICASQEERRTKIKNDKDWPQNSINYCLKEATKLGINSDDIEYAFYEKPFLKLSRRIYQNPKATLRYFKEAWNTSFNKARGYKKIKHHAAHALVGCATAPFENGIYLMVDAIGEWDTTTWGVFDQQMGIYEEGSIKYPHSIGLLYSAFTRWLGLKPNEDEYIVMGAAAYGTPKYAKKIFDEFIEIKLDGTYRLKKNVHNGVEQYLRQGISVEEWYDWCASIQKVCEDVMINLVLMLQRLYAKGFNLVLGGGVALNCVANSKLLQHPDLHIKDIWILPSPGDSGNALGAAAYAAGLTKLNWTTPFLGKDMDDGSQPTQVLIRDVVHRLEQGEIIGWIQGNEEFGPRALGHRSLLADPRFPDMKNKVNKIKHRQEFRPFAPAVLEEDAFWYFDLPCGNERCHYMQFTARVKNPDLLPAICHIDNTSRVQTVPKSTDSFRRLLEHWKKSTDCAVLLNTSLNIKGQPLISERKDAIKMLMDNPMDALVIGNHLYYKVMKSGLDDEGELVEIVECKDYSNGADDIVQGRF